MFFLIGVGMYNSGYGGDVSWCVGVGGDVDVCDVFFVSFDIGFGGWCKC